MGAAITTVPARRAVTKSHEMERFGAVGSSRRSLPGYRISQAILSDTQADRVRTFRLISAGTDRNQSECGICNSDRICHQGKSYILRRQEGKRCSIHEKQVLKIMTLAIR